MITATETPVFNLIHPKDYFLRYAELLGEKKRVESAWIQVEKELWKQTGGYRRFKSPNSLSVAYSRFHKGTLSKNVTLTYSEVIWF